MDQRDNHTVREVIQLILAYGLLGQCIVLCFPGRRLYRSVGLWIGIALAIYMIIHMYKSLAGIMDLELKDAQGRMWRHSLIRYIVVAVVYGLVLVAGVGDPLVCFAGIMGLKVAAFLQPFYHRHKKKDDKEVEE